MANTTKSPLRIAKEALAVGEESLARYGHKHSPKMYTQAQLFAVLVLRQFFKTDYRGIVAILQDHRELRAALRLKRLPHYTTLATASRRFEQKGGGAASLLEAWCERGNAGFSEVAAVVRSTQRG